MEFKKIGGPNFIHRKVEEDMSIFLAVIGFPWQVIKWLWNLTKAAEIRIRLEDERNRLKRLESLEKMHLESLKYNIQNLLLLHLETQRLQVVSGAEPYIPVNLRFINLSVFKLKLTYLRLQLFLVGGGNLLPQLPNLASDHSPTMDPCSSTLIQFNQPISGETRDFIKVQKESHQKLWWGVNFDCDYTVSETGDEQRFQGKLYREEIPF